MIPKLWIYGGIALALLAGFAWYTKLIYDAGQDNIQTRWDRAVIADIATANKAIDDADLQVPELSEADRDFDRALPVHTPRCVQYDPWDRDCKN